jgi:hypothetical protein
MSPRRLAVIGFAVSLAIATAAPALRSRDSFPFSTFPMFSKDHSSREAVVVQVLAVGAGGGRRPLPPGQATGNEAGLQAEAVIRDAISRGAGAVQALCRAAARRASAAGVSFVSLEVATSRFDAVAFFEGRREPRSRQIHGRCWPAAGRR